MSSGVRGFIEDLLPWYNPSVEQVRDQRTEAIRRRSIEARVRSERLIADYEQADAAAHVQHQRLVDETRRADDQ